MPVSRRPGAAHVVLSALSDTPAVATALIAGGSSPRRHVHDIAPVARPTLDDRSASFRKSRSEAAWCALAVTLTILGMAPALRML